MSDADESSLFNCSKCARPNSAEDMVACEQCEAWYHYSCVNVNASIKDEIFICEYCDSGESEINNGLVNNPDQQQRQGELQQQQQAELQQQSALQHQVELQQQQQVELQQQSELQRQVELQQQQQAEFQQQSELQQQVKLQQQQAKCQQQIEHQRQVKLQKLKQASHQRQLEQHQEKQPNITTSSNLDVIKPSSQIGGSISSQRSSVQLELKKLEEMQALELQLAAKNLEIQKQFIERKYQLLGSVNGSNAGSVVVSEKSKSRNTVEWLKQCEPNHRSSLSQPLLNSTFVQQPVASDAKSNKVTFQSTQQADASKTIPQKDSVAMNQNVTPMQSTSKANDSTQQANTDTLNLSQVATRQVISKDLPTFTGDPLEWPMFYAAYESTTRLGGYSDEENMNRLQRCLKKQALAAVSTILLQPGMLSDAIRTLKLLFGKPEQIISAQINKMRAIPNVKQDDLAGLINFAISVKNMVSTIEVSELQEHMSNPILLFDMVQKLPTNMKIDWARFKTQAGPTSIKSFSSWLYDQAEAISDVVPIPVVKLNEAKSEKRSKGYFQSTHVGIKPTSSNETTLSTKPIPNCPLCEGSSHTSANCQRFKSMTIKEKWDTIFKRGWCAVCLVPHKSRRCPNRVSCGIDGCDKFHHKILHKYNQQSANGQSAGQSDKANSSSDANRCCVHRNSSATVIFRILPITLYNNNMQIDTYAFLDDGSSITLMESDLAEKLQLDGQAQKLCLRWTGGTVRQEDNSMISRVYVSPKGKSSKYPMTIRTVRNLDLPRQTTSNIRSAYSHIQNIPVEEYERVKPKILIGLDNSKLIVPLAVKEGRWNEPIATKSRLGWAICGDVNQANSEMSTVDEYNHYHVCECQRADLELNELVKRFYNIDEYNPKKNVDILESHEDRRARSLLESSTVQLNNRYQTGLLWKHNSISFPDSREMAMKRLLCLERKMKQDTELGENLKQQMKDYLQKGYIRKLNNDEMQRSDRTWYLPVFAVRNPNKPAKVRMVWDAAAKVAGVSLNSTLLKGPDYLTPLPDVLWRFREKAIAFSGDICEMFHRVLIQPSDQDSQRFLWRDGDQTRDVDTYVMQVMTFGASCSPCSAHFVKNINAEKFMEKYPKASQAIIDSHYVDDYIDSADTIDEAIQVAKEVKFIHSAAGFHIRNWVSNVPQFTQHLEEAEVNAQKDLTHADATAKILGMSWRTSSDSFCYVINEDRIDADIFKRHKKPTKRQVLRIMMSVFDPLGLIAHFLMYVRIIFQDVWRSGIDWDELIQDREYEKWLTWLQLIKIVKTIEIPRCYIPNSLRPTESIQLHIFTDASENGYAAVAFFRVYNGKQVHCTIIGAKSKVAPLHATSIPRLELMAAVLGVRLKAAILRAHRYEINRIMFWTDSTTVIQWIRSDHRRYKQFVALRIGEILESSDMSDWRWISTKQNVADIATKFKSNHVMQSTSSWFVGPEFLYTNENDWPEDITMSTKVDDPLQLEMRHCFIHTSAPVPHEVIPNSERFSSWIKMVRVHVYILRYLKMRLPALRQFEAINRTGILTAAEIREAEMSIIKQVQRSEFMDEVACLESGEKIVEKSSPIFMHSPYLDNLNVLRKMGRIDRASGIPNDMKRPIILPKQHTVTQLIVSEYHVRLLHQNDETVINEVRQKYVISHLRALLKKIKRNCQACKNARVNPQPPMMAELPESRLESFTQPFTNTGLDYFGPLEVVVGRKVEKRWCALFTCLTVRAIHLELVNSLTTSSCIMAIRNFIARRGQPSRIFSDNATTFHGANNELVREFKNVSEDQIHENFSSINWNFIPPASPHMGGSWERMVRSVKNNLMKALPERRYSEEVLRTTLIEIENIINARPLTYVSTESEEEALTPNHFLVGSSNGLKEPGSFTEADLCLRNNWRISQMIANKFWNRWVGEYLQSISSRSKWLTPSVSLEKDDVVIICDENKRNSWKKGVVDEAIRGADGAVRMVKVRTSSGVYTRPATKVAKLDVKGLRDEQVVNEATSNHLLGEK